MIYQFRPSYNLKQQNGDLSICHSIPVLYRFVEEKYIDEFLTSGRLMISTIRRCRQLENLRRIDPRESCYKYVFLWSDCETHVEAAFGENAFVLCCSLSQCVEHNEPHVYCIELHHWENLAVEIGRCLRQQGFPIGEIFAGPCNYIAKSRVIDMRPMSSEFLQMHDGTIDIAKVDSILMALGRSAFYTTKDVRFAKEQEYRILWLSNSETPVDPVFVTIDHPERFACKVRL